MPRSALIDSDSAITTGVGLILLEMLWAGKSGKVSG